MQAIKIHYLSKAGMEVSEEKRPPMEQDCQTVANLLNRPVEQVRAIFKHFSGQGRRQLVKICQLALGGKLPEEIIEITKLSPAVVSKAIRLLDLQEMTLKQKTGKPQKLIDEIQHLWTVKGLYKHRIAQQLNCELYTVNAVLRKLNLTVHDRGIRQYEGQIISLLQQGYLPTQVGPLLSPPKAKRTAQDLANKVIAARQAEIERGRTIWYPAEVAAMLNLSYRIVRDCCIKNRIPAQKDDIRGWILDKAGIEALKKLYGARKCAECGRVFVPPTHASRLCSPKCASKERNRLHHQSGVRQRSHKAAWIVAVKQALQNYPLIPQERWVAQSEAKKITGLSAIQLEWLVKSDLLAFRYHPTKVWPIDKKTPIKLYSYSQLKLIAKIYREHHPKKKVKTTT